MKFHDYRTWLTLKYIRIYYSLQTLALTIQVQPKRGQIKYKRIVLNSTFYWMIIIIMEYNKIETLLVVGINNLIYIICEIFHH